MAVSHAFVPRLRCRPLLVAVLGLFLVGCGSSKPGEEESGADVKGKGKGKNKDKDKEGEDGEGSQNGEPDADEEDSSPKDDWFKEPGECGEGCNILDPDACGDDERCVSWNCALDPTPLQPWDDSNCRNIGKRTLGQACKRPWEGSNEQHCGKGLVCWGRCRESCQGTREAPSCSNQDEACMLSNHGFVAACLPKCNPLKPDCDAELPTCIPNGHLKNAFVCAPKGRKTLGTYGEPCSELNECAVGHYCIASRFVGHKKCKGDHCCTEYCDVKKGSKGCSHEDARCTPFFAKGAKIAKAYKNLGVCSVR